MARNTRYLNDGPHPEARDVGEYESLKRRLAAGWNTWDTRSVLTHVLLPEAFALRLGLKDRAGGVCLREALIGRQGEDVEQIHPGPHAYDGGYTELDLEWRGIRVKVQSATDGDDLTILVTPEGRHPNTPLLVVEPALLWNRDGAVGREGDVLTAKLPSREVAVFGTRESTFDPYVAAGAPYLAMPLDGPVGVATGWRRSLEGIRRIVASARADLAKSKERFGDLADAYDAMQTCMAWDTIYEPEGDRVVTPVSRVWSTGGWGGFVLFDWDTYFAACMAAVDHPDLAFANAIEITREVRELGFVPNFAAARGLKSRDRSQPPVGSLCVREVFRRFPERWFLEETFDDLLTWNRWWPERRDTDGFLCWGSDPFEPVTGSRLECLGVGERGGAILESGLDNSPMYDDATYDPERHQLRFADVGLMGMYVADCDALADLAGVLGRDAEAAELRERAERYRRTLASLWDEEAGLFLNRDLATGRPARRLSPTHFYPLLARAASPEQAHRMIDEHLLNPDEFWGEWVLPSIARNDPAYPDQTYWRGRIWAPMNFLVYLGLRHYDLPRARAGLAAKSEALLLKEWREKGHVHENYCGDTGEGCNAPDSDRFYHWGGLLGLIALMEAGHVSTSGSATET